MNNGLAFLGLVRLVAWRACGMVKLQGFERGGWACSTMGLRLTWRCLWERTQKLMGQALSRQDRQCGDSNGGFHRRYSSLVGFKKGGGLKASLIVSGPSRWLPSVAGALELPLSVDATWGIGRTSLPKIPRSA